MANDKREVAKCQAMITNHYTGNKILSHERTGLCLRQIGRVRGHS